MSPDIINGLFEFVGSLFTWMNVRQVYKDKGYAGLYLPGIVFFTSWGGWNLYFYPSLGQWWSAVGGASIFLANIVWIALMWRYGKKG
jgi:hypothetical protein